MRGGGDTSSTTLRLLTTQASAAGLLLRALPPAPTVDLVCVGPRHGIGDTRRTIDTAILGAASHAHGIWPEDADLPEMKLE